MLTGWRDPRAAAPVIAELGGTFLFFFVGIGSIGALQFVNGGNPVDPAAALVVVAFAHGLALAVLVSVVLAPIVGRSAWLSRQVVSAAIIAFFWVSGVVLQYVTTIR